jgi:hypothetical protein
MRQPETMPCEIHKIVEIKNIFDSGNEDGRFYVKVDDGWVWCGMLAKDLYRGEEWHKILLKVKPLYLAFYGGWNTTLRIQIWYKNEWHTIWDACNHFNSFKEDKKLGDDYNAASQKYSDAILDCIKRNPDKGFISKMEEMSKKKNRGKHFHETGKGEDLLIEAMGIFDDKVADKTFKSIEKDIGPTGFQAGWAFQRAYYNFHAVHKVSGKVKKK